MTLPSIFRPNGGKLCLSIYQRSKTIPSNQKRLSSFENVDFHLSFDAVNSRPCILKWRPSKGTMIEPIVLPPSSEERPKAQSTRIIDVDISKQPSLFLWIEEVRFLCLKCMKAKTVLSPTLSKSLPFVVIDCLFGSFLGDVSLPI